MLQRPARLTAVILFLGPQASDLIRAVRSSRRCDFLVDVIDAFEHEHLLEESTQCNEQEECDKSGSLPPAKRLAVEKQPTATAPMAMVPPMPIVPQVPMVPSAPMPPQMPTVLSVPLVWPTKPSWPARWPPAQRCHDADPAQLWAPMLACA